MIAGGSTRRRGLAGVALGIALALAAPAAEAERPNGIIVYQSDFGLEDGAVAALHGVARGVARDLILEDLTHEIPPFDVWAAAYRLATTVPYWPAGTVFVSVVDPGVGTDRRSVVARTGSGHYAVTPDNGTLTLVADELGIDAVREIDEAANRLPGSEDSHTFHGRDVYAYTAARLAAGAIAFEAVGPELPPEEIVRIPYQRPTLAGDTIGGTIPILDVRYGNVWTNIDRGTFERLGAAKGEELAVRIAKGGEAVFEGRVPYAATFGDVPEGAPLLYLNSVGNVALAINRGNFAATHGIAAGPEWRVVIRRRERRTRAGTAPRRPGCGGCRRQPAARSPYAPGSGRTKSSRRTPLGRRPSSTASTMSGASRVSRSSLAT